MPSRTNRIAALAALVVTGAGLMGATASPAMACTPHLVSSGPTITISPDLQHPAQSTVSYDTSDFSATVVTCL